MAKMTLDELQSQLKGMEGYTPESEDALRQKAENIYNPQYQQDLKSLRNTVELSLAQQGRNALSNGMQRSSYNQAAQASVIGKGLEAEAQLGAQRDSNIANLLLQLMDKEKDRGQAADQYKNQLLMALYEYGNKGSSGGGGSGGNAGNTLADPNTKNQYDIDLDALMGATDETKNNVKTKPFIPEYQLINGKQRKVINGTGLNGGLGKVNLANMK